jgi:integrase
MSDRTSTRFVDFLVFSFRFDRIRCVSFAPFLVRNWCGPPPVMATALRGTKHKGKVKSPGICALLRLKPFRPHDLRRTAATLAGDLGFDDAWIAKCLDHAASKKSEQIVPTVTGKVYNHSKRMKEKRAVPDGVAAELGRIISQSVPTTQAETELRLAA